MRLGDVNLKFTRDETEFQNKLKQRALGYNHRKWQGLVYNPVLLYSELYALNHYATLDSRKNSTELMTLT